MLKKPSTLSVLLSLVPFTAMCFTVSLWDRVEPTVLGLPFNLAWILFWLVLTPGIMWTVYGIERRR